METVRIPLPGYDPLTDINPDHFSIFSDDDNVLIKEFQRGSITLGPGANQTINHNLGYIPFFLVYVNDTTISSDTQLLLTTLNTFANYFAGSDSNNLVVANNTGSSLTFRYFIFYDEFLTGTPPVITESANPFKIAKSGKSALSTNPNDYIFHSDLNTFKILHQETHDVPIIVGTPTYTFPHNSPLASTSCMLIYLKFPDGKVTVSGIDVLASYNRVRSLISVSYDKTNININYGGVASNYTLHVSWLIFEAPL